MDVSLMLTHEERCLLILPERRPIPANDAVMSNDRLEDAAVVMGFVFIVWQKDDVAALVTDEVFVIRRNQKVFAFTETSGAAIGGQIEFPAW
jgi:hypothetical protein